MALLFVVLFAQAGHAAAAPAAQATTPITGTVTAIVLETDANGITTVLVTLDDQGAVQTVRLSVDAAAALGLVTLDPSTNAPVVDNTQIGQSVTIDPTTVIPDTTAQEESFHPISTLLADFFGEDASVIDGYHNDGFGFGVIAQALWMSQNLTGTEDAAGNASLAGEILQAKQDKDFEAFFAAHPEIIIDGSTPTNWGQFRKALLNKKQNLGSVVSGQSENSDNTVQSQHGNGQNNGNGNNNGNGQGNGNGNNNGNGNGHGNGNGNNKNKDKGKDN